MPSWVEYFRFQCHCIRWKLTWPRPRSVLVYLRTVIAHAFGLLEVAPYPLAIAPIAEKAQLFAEWLPKVENSPVRKKVFYLVWSLKKYSWICTWIQLTRSLANSISDAFFLCTAASRASQAFLTNWSLLTSELSRSFLRVWHCSSAAESSTFKTESWKKKVQTSDYLLLSILLLGRHQ